MKNMKFRIGVGARRVVVSQVKKAAFMFNLSIERVNSANSINDLENFISRFKDKYVSCDLIRIGGESDGGYLLPDNLGKIGYCFSPGVSYTANFEKELSERYDIKSYMADASVKDAPMHDENFVFISKFLGSVSENEFITLSDWIKQSIGSDKNEKILQMDIEGGEYDVLTFEDAATLASFSTMIIEFHNLQKMFQPEFLRMTRAIFEKIYRNFSICHVHPNNCCGLVELGGIAIPRIMEVTFIRNDYVSKLRNSKPIVLPHELDRKNVAEYENLMMPEIWWRHEQ